MPLSLQSLSINLLLTSSPLSSLARVRFPPIIVASEPDKNPRDTATRTGNPSATHLPGESDCDGAFRAANFLGREANDGAPDFVADGLVSVPFGGHNERTQHRLLWVFKWRESKTLQRSKFLGAIANLLDDGDSGLFLLLLLLLLLLFFEGDRLAILEMLLLGRSFLFPRWDPSHPRVPITRGQLLRFEECEVI